MLTFYGNSADQCAGFRGKGIVDRLKRGNFESAALMFCIWNPLMEHKTNVQT